MSAGSSKHEGPSENFLKQGEWIDFPFSTWCAVREAGHNGLLEIGDVNRSAVQEFVVANGSQA